MVGSAVANVPHMATAAYYATSSALLIVRGATPLWNVVGSQKRSKQILTLLAASLAPGHEDFVQATKDARLSEQATAQIPTHTGIGAVDKATARLRANVPRLHTAGMWLTVLPQMLGNDAAAHYLFAWENAAEIRPVGGLIGAGDLMTLRDGRTTNWFTGSQMAREKYFPHVPLPETIDTYETSFRFLDSNASPDFPTSARLERWTFGNDSGQWADGVVDFVDQGVPDILKATGPIYLKQYHVSVNTRNAIALANHYAGPKKTYRGPQHQADQDTRRKQFLGFEFEALIEKIEQLPVKKWPALAIAMSNAIARRDILLFDERPAVERAIRAVGADGSLTASTGDFLAIVDDNRSYNKIAPYVHEWASYNAELLPNMWIDSTVTIHYHLDKSPAGIEGEGPCFGVCGSKHDFRDVVRMYAPLGATSAQHSASLHQITAFGQTAYGMTQFAGWFQMKPGQSRTITIEYAVPANSLSFDNFHQYRLTVPRQAGSRLTSINVALTGLDGVSFGRKMTKTYQTKLSMSRQRSISVAVNHHGQPATTLLPYATQRDPFIPYSAFKDAGHPL